MMRLGRTGLYALMGLNVSPGERWAKFEQHITGDVALAIRQYLMATGDTDILRTGRLAEAVIGIADFWRSRVVYNHVRDKYEILDVMPPDEYNWPVNNSVYTNYVAKLSLLLPKYALALLGKRAPVVYEEMANKIYTPFDPVLHFHPEFDGFTMNTTVKQADVVLLGYPLAVPMDKRVRRNDLTIYENMIAEGPAMTWSMFAIGWLELGDTDKAALMFDRQLANKQAPFNVWTEYADGTGATNFITGMGGYLQSLVFGYGGLRLHADRLELDCTPLPGTDGFTVIGLDYLARSLDFVCEADTFTITLTKGSSMLMFIPASGESKRLVKDKTIRIPRQKVAISSGGATSVISSLGMLILSIFHALHRYTW